MPKLFKILIVSLFATFAGAGIAQAQKASIYTGLLSNTAVGGYDPVSYFDGSPARGSRDFTTEYMGAEWRFVSQANLDKFTADPAAYAPQYGGYCAWAVSQGYTAKGDPRYWKIVDGKLYLNFSESVQETWETDIPGFIAKADENWPGVLQ